MEILKTIKDSDIGLVFDEPTAFKPERKTARAVVFDNDNKVAFVHSKKIGYYKLPGGGVESGEDLIQGLRREMKEEIGCEIEDIKELGIIEEFRNKTGVHQTSYCYIAYVKGDKGEPELQQDEVERDYETIWLSLEKGIKILENEKDFEVYESKFMHERDMNFIYQARLFLEKL